MNTPKYPAWQNVQSLFKQIWGYENFRSPQGEIIHCLLAGKDALIVMPTGGGKSICFQLPALLQTGLTLVVSPLVALMENQVQELRDRQLPAALLHSQLSPQKRRQTLQSIEENRLRLLYLSPETLLSPPVWNIITKPSVSINGLILDEAHCLVQWGDTFRPAYRRLGAVRSTLVKFKPKGTKIALAAFTATADPDAQQTIKTALELKTPQLFLLSPYRSNLHLKVKTVWTPKGRKQQLFKFIETRKHQTGLVYVRTRQDSEELSQWLQQHQYSTAAYHAGLSAEERRQIETAWLTGKIKFVVCTSAFGMGINKPDVRWVIHFQPPFLLSEYIQEVGRAGRDGQPSEALTLVNEPTGLLYPEDQQRRKFLQESLKRQEQEARNLVKKLPQEGNIDQVNHQFKNGAIALSLLHSTGQLQWQDPFNYTIATHPLKSSGNKNQQALQQMAQYFQTRQCRWKFLLEAFGFSPKSKAFRCEHCDNCRSQ